MFLPSAVGHPRQDLKDLNAKSLPEKQELCPGSYMNSGVLTTGTGAGRLANHEFGGSSPQCNMEAPCP